MNTTALSTPCFLVDAGILDSNIKNMAALCAQNGKQLWPMIKTHKSTEIAAMQKAAGAAGFLVGTLDEAEKLIAKSAPAIMIAYPVIGDGNLRRLLKLIQSARILVTFDGAEAAAALDQALSAAAADRSVDYLIKIDCGLHRLGVLPEKAGELAAKLRPFRHLNFKGIATHPGHVYAATDAAGVKAAAEDEIGSLAAANAALRASRFDSEIVATGSTPTAAFAAGDPLITALRPGNYVFNDNIQLALRVAAEENCALTVLATIISRPQADVFIIDGGSKCLGLDKGAHATSLVSSYGLVKGHPELNIVGLSEEIGKIKITGKTSLQCGDKLEIIPNHSCSAANMTNYLIKHRQGEVDGHINIDMRGGSRLQNI